MKFYSTDITGMFKFVTWIWWYVNILHSKSLFYNIYSQNVLCALEGTEEEQADF